MKKVETPSISDRQHKFNNDLLTGTEDQSAVRVLYPNVSEAFIDPGLISRFLSIDAVANAAKRSSQRSGRIAVVLGALSLVGLSASPLYHHMNKPFPAILDGIAATLGMVSVIIAFFGVLHSNSKLTWLETRWETERIRQFHFQYNVANLSRVAGLAEKTEEVAKIRADREKALSASVPIQRDRIHQRFLGTLSTEQSEKAWLVDIDERAASGEPLGGNLEEFFRAYRDLRIGHQMSYAKHVLGRKRGPLRMSLHSEAHWIERVSIASVLVLFCLHLAVVCGSIFSWPLWLKNFSASPLTHVISIWIATFALAAKVIGSGSATEANLARYSDYLLNLTQLAAAYDRETSVAGRFLIMQRVEELVYTEMVSFLRSANNAQYLF